MDQPDSEKNNGSDVSPQGEGSVPVALKMESRGGTTEDVEARQEGEERVEARQEGTTEDVEARQEGWQRDELSLESIRRKNSGTCTIEPGN